jgi:hypothetical protein
MSVLSLKSNSSLTARTIRVAEATTTTTVKTTATKVTRATDIERGPGNLPAAQTDTAAAIVVEKEAVTIATTAFK